MNTDILKKPDFEIENKEFSRFEWFPVTSHRGWVVVTKVNGGEGGKV